MFLAALLTAVPASAQRVGVVKSTDIVTFIDGSPIESYNYNDNTYIEAESLAAYGFDVKWNPEERRLDISRGERAFTPYVSGTINERKAGRELFVPVYDVYATDIVTYINGEAAGGINVGGRTLVSNDYMELFGDCVYDNNRRVYSIDILGREISDCDEKITQSGAKTCTERGFFDSENNLIYGVHKEEWNDRFGSYCVTERGDFAKQKLLTVTDNFKYNDRIAYDYITEQSDVCLVSDNEFRYGIRIVSAHSNAEDSYCAPDGQLCAVVGKDNAEVYKEGNRVYHGAARSDILNIDFYDYADEYSVLYLANYSDADGVIYYIPENKHQPMRVFWRGNVVNGVAHGLGTAYADSDYIGEKTEYYLDAPTNAEMRKSVDENVLARGYFYNGVPNGNVEMYQAGGVRYIGEYAAGKANGTGREFSLISDGKASMIYAGGYADGERNGTGTEYAVGFGDWDRLIRFTGEWRGGNPYNGTLFDDGHSVGSFTDGVYADD